MVIYPLISVFSIVKEEEASVVEDLSYCCYSEVNQITVARMPSGEYRRSARILELDARRSQQAESQNKGKGTCGVALEDVDAEEDNFNLKRGRKRVKIRPVQDLVVNKIGYQAGKVNSSVGY